MYLDIVSNYDVARFGTNLGFQFGTRPLVFFAPNVLSGHFMGAFGHGSVESVIVRIVSMAGHGFQVSQMA